MSPASFLDALKQAADRAAAAEDDFRREAAARAKELERERAFGFRRLNFMRAVSEAIATAEDEATAVGGAGAIVRAKLGWSSDSEARAAVLSAFTPVAQAIFVALTPAEDEDAPRPDVIAALAAFEAWYAETHPGPFWDLFEQYMPETPVVDF
jgi:hypothetical protein